MLFMSLVKEFNKQGEINASLPDVGKDCALESLNRIILTVPDEEGDRHIIVTIWARWMDRWVFYTRDKNHQSAIDAVKWFQKYSAGIPATRSGRWEAIWIDEKGIERTVGSWSSFVEADFSLTCSDINAHILRSPSGENTDLMYRAAW